MCICCVSSEAALTCDLRMLFCCHDVLMDVGNEMIDFTLKYTVFHWHSLESYKHFQNLAEYIKYVAFLYCIYQCNILPVGSHKTYLPSCSHSSDGLPLPCGPLLSWDICPMQPDSIQTFMLEPLRWIQQVLQAPIDLCCMMQIHVCTCR